MNDKSDTSKHLKRTMFSRFSDVQTTTAKFIARRLRIFRGLLHGDVRASDADASKTAAKTNFPFDGLNFGKTSGSKVSYANAAAEFTAIECDVRGLQQARFRVAGIQLARFFQYILFII